MTSTELNGFAGRSGVRFHPPVAEKRQTELSEPEWNNVRAPDARAKSSAASAAVRNKWRILKALIHNPNAVCGLIFLAVVMLAALLAPVLYPGDPLAMVARPFLWPGQNPAYPLGTDSMGRDVLSGVLHGARVSLFVGLVATALGLTFGVLVGATAGYFGSWIDDLLVRLIEIFQTLPSFVLLVVMVAIAQPTASTITLAIAIITWPTVARLARAEFRQFAKRTSSWRRAVLATATPG